jgi:GTP-binding protein
MPERGEEEARADVARRLDAARRGEAGPVSYEIGSDDDPDRLPGDLPGDLSGDEDASDE